MAQRKNLLGGLPLRVAFGKGGQFLLPRSPISSAYMLWRQRRDISERRFRAHIHCETIKGRAILFGAGGGWRILEHGDRRDVTLDSSEHGVEEFRKTPRESLDFRVYNSFPSCSGPFGQIFPAQKMVSLATPAPAEPPAVAR